jgi:acetyl esterase/lipase
VEAALEFLVGAGGADPARTAIVGTSIGANLTVAAAVRDRAKCYVSLSARQSAVEIYAGSAATGMQGVYYFAAEQDGGGVQASDARAMFDETTGPREIQIYDGSDHGIAILTNHGDARGSIVDWLAAEL